MILPKGNQKDWRKLPDEVRAEMEFIFVERIEEVLAAAIPQLAEHLPVGAIPQLAEYLRVA